MDNNNWQSDTLANICDSVDYGLTESAKPLPIGPKFLRITDIVDGFINWAAVPYCKIANEEKEKYQLHDGDIVIARTGATTGYSIYVKNPPDAVFASYLVRYKVKKEFDAQFVSYFLKSPDYWEYIRAVLGDKSAQPNASASTIAQVKIKYPPLPEQRAIAGILGTLDDKIELNRRMNGTLESIASAVFREWFVDNDEAQGWKVVPMPEIIEVNPTRTLKKGEIAPYLDMANMPTRGHRGIEWVDRPYGSGTKFTNGDTLLARITPCLENGKTAFVDFLNDNQIGWGSTEYIVFHPKPPLPPEYGYLLARGDELRNHAIVNMTGTSGRQRTPASCFDNFFVSVPPDELAKKFGEFVRPLFAMIKANDEESRTLANIRNGLLPKLMSGKVSIKPSG